MYCSQLSVHSHWLTHSVPVTSAILILTSSQANHNSLTISVWPACTQISMIVWSQRGLQLDSGIYSMRTISIFKFCRRQHFFLSAIVRYCNGFSWSANLLAWYASPISSLVNEYWALSAIYNYERVCGFTCAKINIVRYQLSPCCNH